MVLPMTQKEAKHQKCEAILGSLTTLEEKFERLKQGQMLHAKLQAIPELGARGDNEIAIFKFIKIYNEKPSFTRLDEGLPLNVRFPFRRDGVVQICKAKPNCHYNNRQLHES